MDDGWDLYAVVRSCTAAAAADTGSIESNRDSAGDAGSGLNKLTFENEDDPFCFSGLAGDDDGDSFQGLEEIYKELCVNNQQPITTTTHIAPTATVPIVGEFEEQRQQQVEIKESSVGSYISFPAANLQTVRPRRRKNQQKKVVKQMTQEELGGDSWAWRKYGQKPIKGSPYPRNYYRCSSSKGCAARKQVERSPADSAIFIVSYTGEHTHPRPTHRSSLAGSTRNKLSDTVMTKPTYGETSTTAAPNVAATGPSCSISSPTSVSSLSPVTTPLTEDVQMEDLPDSSEMAEAGDMEDDDDGEMLIPNAVMAEDIFKGFQELGGSNIDSDLNFILSPSGTTGSTTGTASNFGLRGGY